MKRLFNITLATLAVLSLNSCLKKRDTTLDGPGPRNVVEFKNTGSNSAGVSSFYPLYTLDMGVVEAGDSKFFNVNVSYSGANVAPTDLTVQLEVDQAALDRFNQENETDYVIPPSDVFTFPTTFVIKKGERMKTDSMKINIANDFDFSASYAIPLKIKSVSPSETISGNFGAAIYAVTVRNQFDGVYEVTGEFSSPNPSWSGDYPKEVTLISTGASSCAYFDGDLGGFGYVFYTGTGYSYFGNWCPQFTFDANGNVIKVDNYLKDPAPRSRTSTLDTTTPGAINKFDLNTRTMDVNYDFWSAGSILGKIHEVFKYKGPR